MNDISPDQIGNQGTESEGACTRAHKQEVGGGGNRACSLLAKACVRPENRLHSVIHAETPHVLTICPATTEQSLTERVLLVTYPKIQSPLLYGRTPVVWGQQCAWFELLSFPDPLVARGGPVM